MANPDNLENLSKSALRSLVEKLNTELVELKGLEGKREIDAKSSYYEDKVDVEHGDLVGRDKHGLSGEEVNQIIETLLKHFNRKDLSPERLDTILGQYKEYHATLQEWKELHNYLDNIMSSFSPYNAFVSQIDYSYEMPRANQLLDLWGPVSAKVSSLLDWATEINFIGKRYRDIDGEFEGEKWAVFLCRQCKLIENLLNSYPSALIKLSFRYLHLRPSWWNELYGYTRQFDHIVAEHMSEADKKLREVAGNLHRLSQQLGAS